LKALTEKAAAVRRWFERMLGEFIAPLLIITLLGSAALAISLGLQGGAVVAVVGFVYGIANAILPLALFYAVFRFIVRRAGREPSAVGLALQAGLALALLAGGLLVWTILDLLAYDPSLSSLSRDAFVAEFKSEFAGYLPLAAVAGLAAPFVRAIFERSKTRRAE
jgi:hypothetical protein